METLRPVEFSEWYIKRIAKGMKNYFWDKIFSKIFAVLNDKEISIFNANDPLEEALRSGKIYYQNGAFKAVDRFSNEVAGALEKLGAKFKYGAYYLSRAAMPVTLDNLIALIATKEALKISALQALLLDLYNQIGDAALDVYIERYVQQGFKKLEYDILESAKEKKIPIIEYKFKTPDFKLPEKKIDSIEQYWKDKEAQAAELHDKWKKAFDERQKARDEGGKTSRELKDLDDKVQKASDELYKFQQDKYKNAPNLELEQVSDITSPETSVQLNWESKKIAEDYVYNMKYWVQNWEAKNIIKMRQDVVKMVNEGARVEEIKKYLMKRWNIAERKAEFLARQESNLASSVIKATRYQGMGFTHFKWGRSDSICKRPYHLELAKPTGNKYGLNGENIFSYKNPPIIQENKKDKTQPDVTGQRGLPRQIWNCKCHQLPCLTPDFIENRQKLYDAQRNIFTKIAYAIKNSKQRNNNAWRYRRFGQRA